MELGMIGLGRMGANMTLRLLRGGHRVVGFDFNPDARKRVEQHGAESRCFARWADNESFQRRARCG